jgi:surfactin synthase thioesterase subunit
MPQDPGITLAVMGHSMPHKQQIETAERVRAKWPAAKILFLMSTSAPITRLSPKEYECGSAEPTQLIHACRHILGAA